MNSKIDLSNLTQSTSERVISYFANTVAAILQKPKGQRSAEFARLRKKAVKNTINMSYAMEKEN